MRYGLLGFDFQISIHALREEGDPKLSSRWTRPTNFYPRPPRGGRQPLGLIAAQKQTISIHALREEGDLQKGNVFVWVVPEISIHALREEGDPFHARFRRWKADFYPRPPRGGRLDGWNAGLLTKDISIHALREEGD